MDGWFAGDGIVLWRSSIWRPVGHQGVITSYPSSFLGDHHFCYTCSYTAHSSAFFSIVAGLVFGTLHVYSPGETETRLQIPDQAVGSMLCMLDQKLERTREAAGRSGSHS